MKEKRGIGFLDFEWKKIILPIIILILFIYQVYIFYSIGNVFNRDICNLTNYAKDAIKYRQQNNTEMLKKIFLEYKPLEDKFKIDIEKIAWSETVFYTITKIDHFFPVPCEIPSQNYCKNYINKESFDCLDNLKSNSELTSSMFNYQESKYNPISIWLLILHFILLFVIMYLISAIILWIFRNVKIKK